MVPQLYTQVSTSTHLVDFGVTTATDTFMSYTIPKEKEASRIKVLGGMGAVTQLIAV